MEENKEMSKSDLLWNELRVGFELIYENKRQNLPKDHYMVMYQKVYRFCTTPQTPHQTYKAFDGTEFYQKLEHFLESYVKNLKSNEPKVSDHHLLRHYINQWSQYKFSSNILNGICSYLNRHWVRLVRNSGNYRIHEIFNLCLVLWRKHYVEYVNDSLDKRIIDMIRVQRSGKSIDLKLVKDVLETYIIMDAYDDLFEQITVNDNQSKRVKKTSDTTSEANEDEKSNDEVDDNDKELAKNKKDNNTMNDNETQTRKFYLTFEEKFLRETEDHYSTASEKYIRKKSFLQYMIIVEKIYFEELRNAQLFLDDRTEQPLMNVCDNALVVKHSSAFIRAFEKLLKDDKKEDLCRLYSIVQRIPKIVDNLEKIFEQHVKEDGLHEIEECGDKAMKNGTLFVETILTVHHKYENMIKEQFYHNKKLSQSLENSCDSFVNDNYVTRKQQNKSESDKQNHPEIASQLLAKYSDRVLSKKKTTDLSDQQINAEINEILLILHFIHDKDAFVKSFIHLLAKRLVTRKSYSNDIEEKMIDDLKKVCGQEYITKMQHMNTDIVTSKQIRIDFILYLAKNGIDNHRKVDIDFDLLVLHSGSWPLEVLYTVKLPPEFDSNVQLFAKYYILQHNTRLLNWLCTLSKGYLLSHCFTKPYKLFSTIFEMCVLLQYNYGTQFTVKQLVNRTEMDRKMLLPLIRHLAKFKLLIVSDNNINANTTNNANTSAITDDNIVSLNTAYQCDKRVVNIYLAVKTEAQQEIRSGGTVEEDNKIRLQCAIVRIMKVKKTIRFKQLCAEVFNILKSQTISMDAIKAGVDILVEKDYMKLVENTDITDTYKYIP